MCMDCIFSYVFRKISIWFLFESNISGRTVSIVRKDVRMVYVYVLGNVCGDIFAGTADNAAIAHFSFFFFFLIVITINIVFFTHSHTLSLALLSNFVAFQIQRNWYGRFEFASLRSKLYLALKRLLICFVISRNFRFSPLSSSSSSPSPSQDSSKSFFSHRVTFYLHHFWATFCLSMYISASKCLNEKEKKRDERFF